MMNTLQKHLDNALKQLSLDNGYPEDVHHLDMHEDHQEIMCMVLEWHQLLKGYRTLSEMKSDRAEDTRLIKAQLNEYLDKYLAEGEDTATLIGDLL
ncbi:MAG: hypothetical protein DRG09_04755 [Epsilonproteobacteria bacterium]|nr:MAG: hypothetical protein DRG09_04755 [Campylobacterota bacterium]